ncbi:diacylglycerol kinase family lipid kinase [Ensifer sp. ENS10]|uniref:diacylglycerol/lipid kinase family protein n=1 Tax=unclassified Ensifer TaxID=2633371 RepID=UPI00070E6E96|nr:MULTISPECIES: diacylglycerol kinase family protein [unclassified Ensifer]KRD56692.1 diacylglycerol kinase [Ensifer sp. Root278]MBD9506170.1 diacylglycerol kinase family lipid kinase [Ensifer sp. ENS10]
MKITAIFNREGGTFRTTDMAAYGRKVEEVFHTAGHQIEIATVSGSEMRETLERTCRRDDLDAIIAGGGDGTISAAAGVAWKNRMPLGVVPAGTMNLFARTLKLPLDIWKVPEVLANGVIIDGDIGSADGRAFVHQFSMGLHARMVRYRESFSFRSRAGKIAASTRAAVGVILNPPDFEIEFDVDGHKESRHVSAVSVSNNPFGRDTLMYADDVTAGHLGFYTAPPLSPPGVAKLAFDVMRGKFRDSPLITAMSGHALDLHFPKVERKINCVIDGELLPMGRDVALRIHPGELKLLVGADRDGSVIQK